MLLQTLECLPEHSGSAVSLRRPEPTIAPRLSLRSPRTCEQPGPGECRPGTSLTHEVLTVAGVCAVLGASVHLLRGRITMSGALGPDGTCH